LVLGGGGTVQARIPVLVHLVQRAVSFVAGRKQGPADSRLSAAFAGFGARQLLFPLKLLRRVADNSFVQRSALIMALSLALGGVTLAGIGEWAAGRFDGSAVDPGSSSSAASTTDYGARLAAVMPELPILPETSAYLPANTPGYTVHHDVPEVRLQFTVADEQGRLMRILSPADVRVLDDQLPVAHFTDFERDDNLPLRLGIVLDTSDSVKRVLPEEKAAALKFLDRVMRPQTDNAFVMAFGGNARVWQTPTADRQQLSDAVERIQQPGWGTRFFDALYSACTGQFSAQDDKQLVHRAIVVLSDGDDTDSLRGLADVIAIAQRGEIQIYALTLHSPRSVNRGDQVLRELADESGGRFYIAASSKDLGGAFTQIERDLRAQYYVSFPPQARPGFHSLRVEIRTPQKLEIHARQGYYAQ
jgi:Ca-activated chloride channel family protein